MNLIEFPDDNIAFVPNSVQVIRGETSNYPTLSCPPSCPERMIFEFSPYDSCENINHVEYPEYTVISVAGKELGVNRPFHDVMLIITANLLDNDQTGVLS